MSENNNRLVVFDLLRVIAILMVVAIHVSQIESQHIPFLSPLLGEYGIPNIITAGVGGWGVIIFIAISGAVLEYTHGSKINSGFDYKKFIFKRLMRIYPAYWLSLIIALAANPGLISTLPYDEFLKSFSGFQVYFQEYGGQINNMGWFIGLIVTLYLLYPMLSKILKLYGFPALVFIILFSSFVTVTIPPGYIGANSYWNPLARLANFSIGIYLIQVKVYPKAVNKSVLLKFLSDLSFPVFLVHCTLLRILTILPDYFNMVAYIFAVLFFSILIYYFDMTFKMAYSNYTRSAGTSNTGE